MNEAAIFHLSESKFCYAVDEKTIEIRLRMSRFDFPDEVSIIYGGKYTYAREQIKKPMIRSCEDRLFAYYHVILPLKDVRLVYIFEIQEKGKRYFYSEDGLTDSYNYELSYYNCFTYAYVNTCDVIQKIKWMEEASFYQIFIDRFRMGNFTKNLSYLTMKWEEIPNPKSFAGGDLKGIIEKLDYLKDLGVTALYLTPVFSSISNHKYDIKDYYKIDEQFGTKEDLRALVKTAHLKGIRVVLDAVFNHCSNQIVQFQDVILHKKNSKYYNWFLIKNDEPLEYETFSSCAYMPKFNTSNSEVCNFLIDIAVYWIQEFDIDGWRLDVSDEVSHDFWRQFRKAVKRVKKDCVLIGENWHDANVYLQGDQFDSIMNYAFTKACLDYFAFGSFDATQMAFKLNEILMRNADPINSMMLNLLDTHDTHRFLTRVEGNKAKLMCAIALLYFFPGTPCIYYGTENEMLGGYDPDCRRTFDWNLENVENPTKSLIKELNRLRKKKEFIDAKVKIYAQDELLILERKAFCLFINQSTLEKQVSQQKEIFSNRYENQILLQDGFLITEKRDKK